MGRYVAMMCGVVALLWCAPVMAQSVTVTDAITQAQQSSDESMRGLAMLKSRGASVMDVLVMESLPKGGTSAELAITFKGYTLRYPIKLTQSTTPMSCGQSGWTVSWSPDEAYTNALLNVVSSGALPAHDPTVEHPEWYAMARLPALPLVVTAQKIFTPYGKIDWSELEQDVDPAAPGAEVMPPAALVQHGRRWILDYLEDEQGAAGVDIIADARLSWQQLNRLIFGVSSLGLYKVYLVLAGESESLRVLESAAPVFGSLPGVDKPVPLVLGYYKVRDASKGALTHGWRVSQGKAMLSEPDACNPEMSFCTSDVAGFTQRFTTIVERMRAKKPENPQYAMFASTREVTLGDAVVFLQHAGAALGIPQSRVFIGYIKR